ncbi:cleft lip and palate associated transmembrane protein-like [Citrus sinensis]|uniref:Cleft lip and palate associated transmembrane protein-like n=1 Tax=Citrus sinensis TaxID=2711 RepID=A0ACB8J7Y4_CITSI|nr:cleft lip and palate associated transmembrane protein-like [Citrus sinensis]
MAPPPPAQAAGGGGGGQQQRQQQAGGLGQTITGVIRIAVFWYFASKFFAPKRPAGPESAQLMSNLFQRGEYLDMWLYVSEHEKFNDFGNEGALIWHETNMPYAVWSRESTRTLSLKYYPTEALKNNGSLYVHVFFARSGYPPDPNDPEYQPLAVFGKTHSIVVYYPKSKADKKRSLLRNPKDSEEAQPLVQAVDDPQGDSEDDGPVEWISFWKPNITINLVDDFTRYPSNAAPPNIAPYLNVEPTTGNYFPTIFFNEFWLLRDKLIPINETVTELPLNLEVGPISMTKWQLFLQIDQSFQIHRSYGSMLEGEADELKLIVFLYLLDNDTSWMILASSGVGCCIEFWKIGKAMHIEIDRSGTIPMLRFRDRESYAGNKTKEYDDIAMKYLSGVLFFLAICSSIYSLMYERHKSWYSWILSSLTSCVYMFGFTMMCPQLFINYKLKSVAHLPWRQMTYKFLNTIIDDLFAFVIKMPTLHRLSVFRDDLVFLIYLYQRWIYKVDKTRVNEFGFAGEDDKVSDGTETDALISLFLVLLLELLSIPFLPRGKKCMNPQHNRMLLEHLQGFGSSSVASTDAVAADRMAQLTA